jgi:hypothetical protein
MNEIDEEILSKLLLLARANAWSDEEEFNPYDSDDAYYGGCIDGKIVMARWILDSMGIEWRE